MIDKSGIYELSEAAYHADPCPRPSASAGVLHTLIERSPRHAWLKHPRLNLQLEPERARKFDLGKAAHALLLQGMRPFVSIDAADYRTNAAKAARDAAYAGGKIPLLPDELAAIEAMANSARAQLAMHEEAYCAVRPEAGLTERSLIWREGDVWCRIRPDLMPAQVRDGSICFDYKSTSASAHPEAWSKSALFDHGNDIRWWFYRRGIKAVLGADVRYHFIVQETAPPFALSIIALDGEAEEIATRRGEAAIGYWRWCLEHDRWPGYPRRTAWVGPPRWQAQRWLDEETRVAVAKEAGEDMLALMLDWQAPIELQPQSKEAERVQAG